MMVLALSVRRQQRRWEFGWYRGDNAPSSQDGMKAFFIGTLAGLEV